MYRTVVVPLDLTAEAEAAIAHGATIARQAGAALVALTTRGRSGYGRLVMGSVALEVAHHSTVPVLVARPRPYEVR